MIKKIPIKRIETPANFPFKEAKIERYYDNYKKGEKFPLIHVYPRYILQDGNHRMAAQRKLGEKEVWASVIGEKNNICQKNYDTFAQFIKNIGCHSSGGIRFIWDYFCEGEPKTYVEVGVYKGANACRVRKMWSNTEMFLVDPWMAYYAQQNQSAHDKHYAETCEKFKDDKLTKIIRKPSVEGAKEFYPNQLDIVFIDGNHKYQPVLDDIEAWYPLVRPGGVLCGHDYSPDHPEVSKAVKEVFEDRHTFNGKGGGDIWFHIKDDIRVSIAMVVSKPKFQYAARMSTATFYHYTDYPMYVYTPKGEEISREIDVKGIKRQFDFNYDTKLRYATQLKPQGFLQILKDLDDDEIVMLLDADTFCIRPFGLTYDIIREVKKGKIAMVPEPWNRYESLHGDPKRPDYIPKEKRLTYVNSGVIIASKKSIDMFEKFVEMSKEPGFSLGPFHDQTIINYALCQYFPDRVYYIDKKWNGVCTHDPETTIIGHNGGGVGVGVGEPESRHSQVCKAILAPGFKDWFKIFKSYDKKQIKEIPEGK